MTALMTDNSNTNISSETRLWHWLVAGDTWRHSPGLWPVKYWHLFLLWRLAKFPTSSEPQSLFPDFSRNSELMFCILHKNSPLPIIKNVQKTELQDVSSGSLTPINENSILTDELYGSLVMWVVSQLPQPPVDLAQPGWARSGEELVSGSLYLRGPGCEARYRDGGACLCVSVLYTWRVFWPQWDSALLRPGVHRLPPGH